LKTDVSSQRRQTGSAPKTVNPAPSIPANTRNTGLAVAFHFQLVFIALAPNEKRSHAGPLASDY
jgi:hypothetical protein